MNFSLLRSRCRALFSFVLLVIPAASLLTACSTLTPPKQEHVKPSSGKLVHASYYGRELAGRRTASGEIFNPYGMTAAHKTLPLGTHLRITNPANGKSITLRINDRGPFIPGRELDVSLGAAQALGFAQAGTANLLIEPASYEAL